MYRLLRNTWKKPSPYQVCLSRWITNAPNEKGHLVLIDGSFFVYRAYYALQGKGIFMADENGPARETVFGYTRLMWKLLQSSIFKDCTHLAVVMDTKGSWRKEQFPFYKASRSKMPGELTSQLRGVDEATSAFGAQVIRLKGYEADDVIATYARMAKEMGMKVTVVSQDKDLHQLVQQSAVIQYDPIKEVFIDLDAVIHKFGVPPKLVADVQALSGDRSDNVPGVPTIGPKHAARLIKESGSLLSLIEDVEKEDKRGTLKGLKKKLLEYKQQALECYDLVKLDDRIDGLPSLSDLEWELVDRSRLVSFLESQRFGSLISEVNRTLKPPPKVFAIPRTEEGGLVDRVSPLIHIRIEPEGVTVVDSPSIAQRVCEQLMEIRNGYHACDMETIGFDIREESPFVSGSQIICGSIYAGPQHDFGHGSRIWIDNLDEASGTLDLFKEYFADEGILKVWHNYSFDRAVLNNAGIPVKGFGGDTMHMARLWDAARLNRGGYSLEALSTALLYDDGVAKRGMKDRFGRHIIKKDGTYGKDIIVPDLDSIQRGEEGLDAQRDWIDYSTLDTEATWRLREHLANRLKRMKCNNLAYLGYNHLWGFYDMFWRPFGELLTDMEHEGVKVDIDHLKKMEHLALEQVEEKRKSFLQWAQQYCEDAKYMNPGSDAQKRQLFFAPAYNTKTGEELPQERVFKVENDEGYIEPNAKKAKRHRNITIVGLGMDSSDSTKSGWPAAGSEILRKLAGEPRGTPPSYGLARDYFANRHGEGERACEAIDDLLEMGAIDTLLSNFLVPLQHLPDERGRVHTSMNINTETGRLSCRRPNLQNQPALEKDRYRIRQAFTCDEGNALVVADYGQVELRLLAHMTGCRSMIDAFAKGGDFHSRTALGMYPHIAEAVKNGEVALEGDDSNGTSSIPLLKDVFSSERRKAKTLNFSIAYGKTAMGLAKDWNVSRQEAEQTLSLWFSDRPEVKAWQERTILEARRTGYTTTIMGRRRPLQHINARNAGFRKHSERAAINTPIQGSAADIVMCAMLKVHHDEWLRKMGWRLLLQVHDELILEGPQDSSEEALHRLKGLMNRPLDGLDLSVDLVVDGNIGKTWFEAK